MEAREESTKETLKREVDGIVIQGMTCLNENHSEDAFE